GEHAEDIRLVLVRVHSTAQHAIVELRVVAGDHGVEAQRDGAVQQGLELDLLVAAQARIRGLADGVGVHEVIDHIGLEAVGEVPDVEGDAEFVGDAAGIRGVLQGAAAAGTGAHGLRGLGQRQVHADNLVACFECSGGRDRRIHTTAHCCYYSHGSHPTRV